MNDKTRTQNSIRNISYGFVITSINTVISFVIRTVLVKTLGVEILGLNGLFTEVIAMLSLFELGVGMAIIYSLYKPISENDYKRISQLMGLYRRAYSTIAIVTLFIGTCLTPVIHFFVTDVEYPLFYVRIVFFLFVLKTASSYLFSYKTTILNADQKQYVVSLISAIVKVIMMAVLVVELVLFRNYVVFCCLQIIQAITTNIVLSKYVDKKYPYIDYRERLEKDEKSKVLSNIKNIFIKRVSGVITSSTDNILISTLVSTIQVGYYSNYVMLFSVVRTLTKQFTNGMAASIGNLSVTESAKHCVQVLRRLTFLYFSFGMIMASGLMGVSKAFVTIWLGKDYVMADVVVYVAIYNLFLEICCEPLWQYLEVSGLFRHDKYIGIVGSIINLIVSIILGIRIGIVGIFIGTVCTQLIQLVLKTIILYKMRFHMKAGDYLWTWAKIHVSYALMVLMHFYLRDIVLIKNLYCEFFIKGIISVIGSIVFAVLFFIRGQEFAYSIQMSKKLINRIHSGRGGK